MHRITEIAEVEGKPNPAVTVAKQFLDRNKMGPIVFATPELGRWSTVGGLGVMVDELTIGLAEKGQEVWVISPYYDRNRKGEQGYLQKDPAGFKEDLGIEYFVGDRKYGVGVFSGKVNGVNLIFLHNAEIFPAPYTDFGAFDTVR